MEQFSIKALIEKQIQFYNEPTNTKQIYFECKGSDDIIVNANKNLTEILFSNLLLNAMQHNIENGSVLVEIKTNKVIISNSSHEHKIPSHKLFNRFAKSTQNQQGNGLGLAIVKKIVDQNNWKISYHFSKNWHFFTVEL